MGEYSEDTHGSNGRLCLGLVGSPQGQEATSKQFFFWVVREVLVEETQLVVCEVDPLLGVTRTWKFESRRRRKNVYSYRKKTERKT